MDGHMFHIWWECPSIVIFWTDISTFIQNVTDATFTLTLQMALFGLDLSQWPPKFHPIITNILIAARSIARFWKQALAPTPSSAIDILTVHLSMEFLFAKAKLTLDTFYNHWQSWLSDPRASFSP